jgi:hypothetical protein
MAPVELPETSTDTRRPFRALETSLDTPISRWTPRAAGDVAGDGDDPLIGGVTSGPTPRATVTLIGAGGSMIRNGTLIGTSGTRAPLDPVAPAGSGGAPVRPLHPDGAWDGADEALELEDLDEELLASLAADRERLLDIASALGACPECWGDRIGCPRCGGVGRPGSEEPAADAFEWYVRPLLHRLDGEPPRRRPRPAGSAAHPAGRGPSYWFDPD